MIELDFNKLKGIIPAVVQDHETNEILMLGFINEESWQKTLETGKAWFYSRSRNKLWMKGETSGNILIVKGIKIDCDNDSIVLKAEQTGKYTCHTGNKSCFYREVERVKEE